MSNILEQFYQLVPDENLCEKLIRSHQKEYLRKRLRFIKNLWEGKTEKEAYKKAKISKTTANRCLHKIVKLGIAEGLKELSTPKESKRDFLLSEEQMQEVIIMLETETPRNYDYERNIFTGEIIAEIIFKKYSIKVSTDFVYDMLHRNKYSYHKAHRDYLEADPIKQEKFQETVKKTGK
jgi:transposase